MTGTREPSPTGGPQQGGPHVVGGSRSPTPTLPPAPPCAPISAAELAMFLILPRKDQEKLNNDLIIKNIQRARRRARGEANVEVDDTLYDMSSLATALPTKRPKIPEPREGPATFGAPPPAGFNALVEQLARQGFYLPLTLFTNETLIWLSRHGNDAPIKKFNNLEARPGDKMEYSALDVSALEKRLGLEEKSMIYPHWVSAWANFLRFWEEHGVGGAEGLHCQRWDAHYQGLINEPDCHEPPRNA